MKPLSAAAAAAAFWAAAAEAQTVVDIPLEQASAIATQAYFAGDLRLALQLAEAVLSQFPDDRAALLVVAAGAPQAGNPARGVEAGARAWRLSDNADQRYEAARLTAIAAAADERFTTAAFWMRLALVDAPNEAETERTLTDARAIAQRNPWQTQLSFSLAPSNNVNGGADSEVSTAPGNPPGLLSEDAIAQEGWRASLGIAVQYRFQENTDSRSFIGLNLQTGRVWLTGETDIPNEAFDTNSVEASLRHERIVGEGLLGLSFSRGRFDYRDLDISDASTNFEKYDITRISADYSFAVAAQTRASVNLSREVLDYQSDAIGEVLRTRAGANVVQALGNGDQISLGYSYLTADAANPNYVMSEHALNAGYGFGQQLGPITLSVGAGARWAEYPEYRLLFPVTGGRQDETYSLNANIGFPDAAFAGFIPGVRIDYAITDSNVSRFDRESLGASFSISSSF